MNRVASSSLLILVCLSLTPSALTSADKAGPSAKGTYEISINSGGSREIQFDAKLARDGNTSGEITFRDTVPTTEFNGTGDGEEREPLPLFYAKASCDCFFVEGVEAVLSGTITESSYKDFIGRRVVLAVQDGDSLDPPLRDKLTYGFYTITAKSWVPTDADRPDDQPVPAWVATDAERENDVGVLSQKLQEVTCKSFPISSHSFIAAKQGKGKIEIVR